MLYIKYSKEVIHKMLIGKHRSSSFVSEISGINVDLRVSILCQTK